MNRLIRIAAAVAIVVGFGFTACSNRTSPPEGSAPTPSRLTTAPTATLSPAYCEDPAVINNPPYGCIQENGAVYTSPPPDTVGADFTCYGYAKSDDVQNGINALNARQWYTASSDFEIAAAGFATIGDHTTGPISKEAALTARWFSLASESILQGYARDAYKFAVYGYRAYQKLLDLTAAAGTSCTIPALAGIGA